MSGCKWLATDDLAADGNYNWQLLAGGSLGTLQLQPMDFASSTAGISLDLIASIT
jgi:hypothetical protein